MFNTNKITFQGFGPGAIRMISNLETLKERFASVNISTTSLTYEPSKHGLVVSYFAALLIKRALISGDAREELYCVSWKSISVLDKADRVMETPEK